MTLEAEFRTSVDTNIESTDQTAAEAAAQWKWAVAAAKTGAAIAEALEGRVGGITVEILRSSPVMGVTIVRGSVRVLIRLEEEPTPEESDWALGQLAVAVGLLCGVSWSMRRV